MTTQTNKETLLGSKKQILVTGLLVAGMMAASLMAASPAHAAGNFHTVNDTGDQHDTNPGDGFCSASIGPAVDGCTLRAAIEESNASSGADTINFNIPGTGLHTIRPTSALPLITDQVTMDGYTQTGASPNTLAKGTNAKIMVELDGSKAGDSSGLSINTPNSVVKGLAINRFSSDGIVLFATAPGSRIEGNFIGTDASGTLDLGNGDEGIFNINSHGNTVGGTSPEARNLISGNGRNGVEFSQTGPGNKVLGNLIGTKRDGINPLGNTASGVSVGLAPDLSIGDGTTRGANTIAFNKEGVRIFGFNGVAADSILSNSIFSNDRIGIDLFSSTDGTDGHTPNDTGDADMGSNDLQNFPVLSSAKTSKTGTTIAGKLNSTASETFKVQFFSNTSGTDEGQTFLGETSVATDSSGNASFSFKTNKKVAKGQNITATTTDSSGSSSEFSAPKKVVRKR